ncbi:MAG: (Fe-S)-binding protein, partial [Ignavibacteriota bacterium]
MTQSIPILAQNSRSQKLQACIHCGLCLEACPTYLVSGEEMSSPRGRIHLMKALDEGRIESDDPGFANHQNSCLVCRACETACPSGVDFGILMVQTRELIAETTKKNPLRKFIYERILGSPNLIRVLQYPLSVISKTHITRLFGKTFDADRFPLKKLAASLLLLPGGIPLPLKRPRVYYTMRKKRGSVGLLIGCIGDLFTSNINDATINVLTRLGYDVHTLPEITCCGALPAHAGFGQRARELARNAIDEIINAPIDFYIS